MKKIVMIIMLGAVLLSCDNALMDAYNDRWNDVEVINIYTIDGVAPPAYNETPVTTVTETEQYTGTVTWSPAVYGTFAARTVYTATITLTAKSGYTLEGVTKNCFIVTTTTNHTNMADSGVVMTEFPKTDWATYNLRDQGPAGGWIFYINPNAEADGWKYLEAWTDDEIALYGWKKTSTATGGTSTAIGTGKTNTTAMSGAEHPAAEVVRTATHGNYDDWFLPSKDELNAIWDNLVDDGTGNNSGVGGFDDLGYWSSSEYNNTQAWVQDFSDGNPNDLGKLTQYNVRAVRAF